MASVTIVSGKKGDSYQIRSFCGYDAKGKQIVRRKTWKPNPGMTPKQIEKELQRQCLLFDQDCAAGAAAGNIKFQTFAEQWFKEYAEKNLRPRSVSRLHDLEARTYAALGHLRIDKISTRSVQSFINNLSEDGINQRTGGGLSPKTIRHYNSFISDVMQYGVRMGMIPANPCTNVVLPPLEKKEKDVYTEEEAQAFLQDLIQEAPSKYQAFFVLAMYGGFRRGEILGLEWEDIDFQSEVVTIRRTSQYTKERGVYTDGTKTANSNRSLKLPAEVFPVLRRHRAEQAAERLRLGDQWQPSNRVFVTWNGAPMHPNSTYKWLKEFCAQFGHRFIGVHGFRHLNASLLINAGVDVRTVSASLGHSQTSTTLNIYSHTFTAAQAKASEAIGNALQLKKA